MKILCVGDAMIPGADFANAARVLGHVEIAVDDWEVDWDRLQRRRLTVEQRGPGVEPVPSVLLNHPDVELVLGLFLPLSSSGMDALRRVRLIGVARAGTENVDVEAATARGIVVVNVLGRNAEAVSDFAIGLMLSEARNIARAHEAIKRGSWRKEFSNTGHVPELRGMTIGIVGFGFVGRLVAQKLGSFGVRIFVYDPWVGAEEISRLGAEAVDKDTLFSQADFVTLHARLTGESRNLVGRLELARMKSSAYLVNTARAGLVDMEALIEALRSHRIAGAALDVFEIEPIPLDDPLLALDNVTLTSHLAGTTREALIRSPELLVEEVRKVFQGESRASVKNPETLLRKDVQLWMADARSRLTGGA
jgi:D-3-phosphoglycerate dehydrogenase